MASLARSSAQRARIAVEVLVRGELRRIDEDRGDDAAGVAAGELDQLEVAVVQRAHGRHQRDLIAGLAPAADAGAQLRDGRDVRGGGRHRVALRRSSVWSVASTVRETRLLRQGRIDRAYRRSRPGGVLLDSAAILARPGFVTLRRPCPRPLMPSIRRQRAGRSPAAARRDRRLPSDRGGPAGRRPDRARDLHRRRAPPHRRAGAAAGRDRARQGATSTPGIDAFMLEYGLTSEEGVILMCLAESLLRIPDSETADQLIAEKIGGGQVGEPPRPFRQPVRQRLDLGPDADRAASSSSARAKRQARPAS